MANISTVKDATATNTDVDDDTLNPTVTNTGRTVVHVTLTFDGVNFDPNALYDALDAGYGTVASDKVNSHNIYNFVISA